MYNASQYWIIESDKKVRKLYKWGGHPEEKVVTIKGLSTKLDKIIPKDK